MEGWKVGVAYERYGYITVSKEEASTEAQAVKVAEQKLRKMTLTDLEAVTEYLEDSEEIDEQVVMKI